LEDLSGGERRVRAIETRNHRQVLKVGGVQEEQRGNTVEGGEIEAIE